MRQGLTQAEGEAEREVEGVSEVEVEVPPQVEEVLSSKRSTTPRLSLSTWDSPGVEGVGEHIGGHTEDREEEELVESVDEADLVEGDRPTRD